MQEIQRAGFGLAAISYDPMSVLADFAERRRITFPLLSDIGSATIKAYRLLNTTVPASNRQQYGIPFPGTLIVNRQGVVTSRTFESEYQERDTISSVIVKLGTRVDMPATSVTAPHLRIITFTTDHVVAPGTHFSVVLDVSPDAHTHVYAPGVTGYKPIRLTVEPQSVLAVREAKYPKPSDYFFKPLNEHVAVFDRPFRIIQDVMVGASREAETALADKRELVIKATLDYQACDDKVCFNPQSVPLSWTVQVKALDRERVKR